MITRFYVIEKVNKLEEVSTSSQTSPLLTVPDVVSKEIHL